MILGTSVLELSSDNHLVDGPTGRQTDMSKAIYPLFFEGGHNYTYINDDKDDNNDDDEDNNKCTYLVFHVRLAMSIVYITLTL